MEDFVNVIRTFNDNILPVSLFDYSICGRTQNDHSNDIRDTAYLLAMRQLTASIFDENSFMYRLLRPPHEFMNLVSVHDPCFMQSNGGEVRSLRSPNSFNQMLTLMLTLSTNKSQLVMVPNLWDRSASISSIHFIYNSMSLNFQLIYPFQDRPVSAFHQRFMHSKTIIFQKNLQNLMLNISFP